ncbi:uncharacterized protein LOC143445823 [Clavelina lepadiformis]|uniref:uncharacterized protein LOC143445823 n=1 Tax=Clavelina lepadiformis TaxID=159417 RepID=UPI0040411AA2
MEGKRKLEEESENVKKTNKHAKAEDKENVEQKPMPDVYVVAPPQPHVKKVGQLTSEQLKHYFDKGWLVLKDFFPTKKLDEARKAVDVLVDELANKLYKAGKISNKHEDKDFFNRLTYLEGEFKGTAVLLHKQGILPNSFQNLWADEKMLNVVEQIIGPEIAGHPVWNLRTKTPHNEQTTVPWHQDNAYLAPCSLETLQLTAWIPLVDANMVNGCMQVASGGHRKGITAKHTCCAGGTWYVQLEEQDMVKELGVDLLKDVTTCEVPYGGVLLMNNAIPHQSLENRSEIIRWSLDLRWQRPDKDNGFYGLKKSVLMKTSKNPNYKIDWSEMAGMNRTKKQMDASGEDNDEFSTEISGPWMQRWEIVHHNRHTETVKPDKSTWHKA